MSTDETSDDGFLEAAGRTAEARAALLLEAVHWYAGPFRDERNAHCLVRRYRLADGRALVVLSDPASNRGRRVTYALPGLAMEVAGAYCDGRWPDRWVQHDAPQRCNGWREGFYALTFERDADGLWGKPRWDRLAAEELERLIGPFAPLPPELAERFEPAAPAPYAPFAPAGGGGEGDYAADGTHYRRWRLEAALRNWRQADELLRTHPHHAEARPDYELAIGVALTHLQRFTSVEALVVHHHEDRWAGAWHGGEWRREGAPAGSVEAWLQPAMRAVPTERGLLPLLVEEAALWRRYAQLMAESVAGG